MDSVTLQQSIATLNTCINKRIAATFLHKPCGGGCCCGDATIFDYLILDAVNSPLLTVALTPEQVDCVIAMAQCGSKFPPPPTPDTCVACDYIVDFSILAETCNYAWAFPMATPGDTYELVSYIIDGIVWTGPFPLNPPSTVGLLEFFLWGLDLSFVTTYSGGPFISVTLPSSAIVYSFIVSLNGVESTVTGTPTSCVINYPFYIYTVGAVQVNQIINNYTELLDYMVSLGYEVSETNQYIFTLPSTCTAIDSITYGTQDPQYFVSEVTYDLSTGVYPATYTIDIDGVITSLGICNSLVEVRDALNALGSFTATLAGTTVVITNSGAYGVLGDMESIFDTGGEVCADVPVSLSVSLERGFYVGLVFPFDGLDLTLNGVLYSSGDTFTTRIELLRAINAFNIGVGYFTEGNVSDDIYYEATDQPTGYFGAMTIDTLGTPTLVSQSLIINTVTDSEYDISGLVFPLNDASILIESTTYTAGAPIANAAALVTWINSLPLTLGFAAVAGFVLKIRHYQSTVNVASLVPFIGAVSGWTVVVGGVSNSTGVLSNFRDLVDWMNTLGVGEFGLMNLDIFYIGKYPVTTLTMSTGLGPHAVSFVNTEISGALNFVDALNVCEPITIDVNYPPSLFTGCVSMNVYSYTLTPAQMAQWGVGILVVNGGDVVIDIVGDPIWDDQQNVDYIMYVLTVELGYLATYDGTTLSITAPTPTSSYGNLTIKSGVFTPTVTGGGSICPEEIIATADNCREVPVT